MVGDYCQGEKGGREEEDGYERERDAKRPTTWELETTQENLHIIFFASMRPADCWPKARSSSPSNRSVRTDLILTPTGMYISLSVLGTAVKFQASHVVLQ